MPLLRRKLIMPTILDIPSDFDIALHAASLMVGTLAKRSYFEDPKSLRTSELLQAYTNIRRHISKIDGVRIGAPIAGHVMNTPYFEQIAEEG